MIYPNPNLQFPFDPELCSLQIALCLEGDIRKNYMLLLTHMQIVTFVTLPSLGTSCILSIKLSNARTVSNNIGNICLLMSLVKQMGHWSLRIDSNIVTTMTTSLSPWSNHSPDVSKRYSNALNFHQFCFYLAESNVLRVLESCVKSFLAAFCESCWSTSYQLSKTGPSVYVRVVYGRSSSYSSPLRPLRNISEYVMNTIVLVFGNQRLYYSDLSLENIDFLPNIINEFDLITLM